MKLLFLILIAAVLLSQCTPKTSYFQQSSPKYNDKYADQLEPDSKLLNAWYHYTIEQMPTGEYIRKMYYPDTKQLTHFITYSDKNLQTKHGLYIEIWDDGSPYMEGNYISGKKEGEWVIYSRKDKQVGLFKNGDQTGTWLTYDSLGVKIESYDYLLDKKHGPFKNWDTKGSLIKEGAYEMDSLIWEKDHENKGSDIKGSYEMVERQPYFKGALCEELTGKEKKQCTEIAMLQFIYSNIKYPVKCRELGIEGMAIIEFVVEKDGSIQKIWSKRGICDEIKNECIRVVSMMPDWSPGYQNGEAVRVLFQLPVKFRLE